MAPPIMVSLFMIRLTRLLILRELERATPFLDLTATPGYGPVNETTAVTFPVSIAFNALPDAWFAGTQAQASLAGPAPSSLNATAPSLSQSGPASVKVIEPDGFQAFNPLVFSYGPGVQFVSGNGATPSGGASSDIIGVGLPTDPTQVQVTVGGQNAPVVSAKAVDFYGADFPFAYPYPAVDVKITVPQGAGVPGHRRFHFSWIRNHSESHSLRPERH